MNVESELGVLSLNCDRIGSDRVFFTVYQLFVGYFYFPIFHFASEYSINNSLEIMSF